jgi:hypothetical protein
VVPKVAALTCTSCGAALELHAHGYAVTVVCAACGAQLDAADPNLRVLQYGERVRLTPYIPLGTRGTWKGVQWEVIGCQAVTITVDEVDYSWREYVCFNPYRGFVYLSEYDGHWNIIEKLKRRPQEGTMGKQPVMTLDGRAYKHFQTAVARTTAALGEFPWALRVGDQVVSQDFVAPPFILSAEAAAGDVTWSQGTYTPPDVIRKIFGLSLDLPRPIGVFANQPNPHAALPRRMAARFGLAVVVLLLMLVANVSLAGNRVVYNRSYTVDRATEESGAFVTPVFELDGRPSGVAIDLTADLDNDWVFFTLALIDEASGETREVTRQLEYYSGVDSDGSWSEGSRSESVRLAAVPAGRYFLRVEPEGGEIGRGSLRYTLQVRRDPPHFGFYAFAFFAVCTPLLFAVVPAAAFENRRWAESDHPLGGTTTEDD